MAKGSKSRAEKLFSASKADADNMLKRREKERQDSAEKNAKLRALRLAKEAAEAETATAKSK